MSLQCNVGRARLRGLAVETGIMHTWLGKSTKLWSSSSPDMLLCHYSAMEMVQIAQKCQCRLSSSSTFLRFPELVQSQITIIERLRQTLAYGPHSSSIE